MITTTFEPEAVTETKRVTAAAAAELGKHTVLSRTLIDPRENHNSFRFGFVRRRDNMSLSNNTRTSF